jgi:hypothetical protein
MRWEDINVEVIIFASYAAIKTAGYLWHIWKKRRLDRLLNSFKVDLRKTPLERGCDQTPSTAV